MAKAMFAAGCFWGPEAEFRTIEGVTDTKVGYAGGHKDDPTYREVCRGDTGHAETVYVEYDPDKVSFDALLDAFFAMHDPTQKDRQGPDVGSQYRSAVFTYDAAQKEAAERKIRGLDASGRFDRPIATEVAEAGTFWPAEEYHQRYFEKQGIRHH